MPIRFRCVYCNQLLGISHRKAGTIVRCTSCEGQLIVPDPSDAATEAGSQEQPADRPPEPLPNAEQSSAGGRVFEEEGFDAFLEPMTAGAGPAVASPPAPAAKRSATAAARITVEKTPGRVVTLSPRNVAIAILSAILALSLSFGGGLWLGMWLGMWLR